jgi:transposase
VASPLRSSTFAFKHGASARPRRTDIQKKSFSAAEHKRADVEAKRQAFWDEATFIPPHRLIFLDESGCNTAMTPRYARSPIGERAAAYRPVNRGKNVSIIGAIRLDGLVALRSFEGAINVAKFLSYVERDLLPNTRAGDVLVMDNLSVHKDPSVLDAIESTGVKVLFLPPYSPEFNPIENYWSTFKQALRRFEARTQHDLHLAIKRVAKRLQLNFAPMYRHCGYP